MVNGVCSTLLSDRFNCLSKLESLISGEDEMREEICEIDISTDGPGKYGMTRPDALPNSLGIPGH